MVNPLAGEEARSTKFGHPEMRTIQSILGTTTTSFPFRERVSISHLRRLPPLQRSLTVFSLHSSSRSSSTTLNGFSQSPFHMSGKVNGDADFTVPIYSPQKVVEKLQEKTSLASEHPYLAMYSSWFGGITYDPALMVIPMDDHMVHRGHGVFDTTMIFDGYLYELDSHLDRFLDSAFLVKISLPFPRRTLRSILVQLAAASRCNTGSLRYWLSAGPGDFSLSPSGCVRSAFYAIVIRHGFPQVNEGVAVITSTVPMKPPRYATMKNVNYLPNVHSKMEAEEHGAFGSVWVDGQGYVAEGANANVAFISKNRELVLPSADKILMGCTAQRLLAIANKLMQEGLLNAVMTRDIQIEEAKNSAEMIFVSSLLPILPIVEWDSQPIGDGLVGELTSIISRLFWQDIISGPDTRRLRIPYQQY